MTYINGLNSFSLPDEDYLSNYALLNTNLDDINEELIQNYTIQLDNVNINEKKDDIYTEDTIEPGTCCFFKRPTGTDTTITFTKPAGL